MDQLSSSRDEAGARSRSRSRGGDAANHGGELKEIAIATVRRGPLADLWLTDLSIITPTSVDNGDLAHSVMVENVRRLRNLGARTNGDVPFARVSGFPVQEGGDKDITNPHSLVGCTREQVGILIWGAPHDAGAGGDTRLHGQCYRGKYNEEFKTCAFEAMSWLAPCGLIVMVNPLKYYVKFGSRHEAWDTTPRVLHSGPVSFRAHRNRNGGSDTPISDDGPHHETCSMLIPTRNYRLLHAHICNGVLDFGSFILSYMRHAMPKGPCIELGCNTCGLTNELALTLFEPENPMGIFVM